MSENLAFKGKMVWFGLDWFGMVWFFVLQLVKVVLVSIRTKFELSMCLVCPTIEINVCSAYLQNAIVYFSRLPSIGRESSTSRIVYVFIDGFVKFLISGIFISIVGHTRHLKAPNELHYKKPNQTKLNQSKPNHNPFKC